MATSSVKTGARSKDRQAVEEELRRLMARELHDRVAQTLTGMLVDLENFKSEQVGWDDVLKEMDSIQSSTRQVLSSIRQLLYDLRGDSYIGDRFPDALKALVSRFRESTRIATYLDVRPGWPAALAPAAAINLYRVIEEALANVRLHSGAQSVHVLLDVLPDGELLVAIRDDGRGVDTSPNRPVGFGTVGMRERALLLGGHLRLESENGSGTTVRAVIPAHSVVPPARSENSNDLVTQGV